MKKRTFFGIIAKNVIHTRFFSLTSHQSARVSRAIPVGFRAVETRQGVAMAGVLVAREPDSEEYANRSACIACSLLARSTISRYPYRTARRHPIP